MSNQKIMILGSVLLSGVIFYGLYGIGSSIASGRFERDDDGGKYYKSSQLVMNTTYTEECGSCHLAYPAQLLPAESWVKIMADLENHFGENAEVDKETQQNISSYLSQQSASKKGTYRKMLRNLNDRTPLRITELPYFINEHDEIPSRFIKGNDKVGSLSQCSACHQSAEKGVFDEDDVVIPGFGRWDD